MHDAQQLLVTREACAVLGKKLGITEVLQHRHIGRRKPRQHHWGSQAHAQPGGQHHRQHQAPQHQQKEQQKEQPQQQQTDLPSTPSNAMVAGQLAACCCGHVCDRSAVAAGRHLHARRLPLQCQPILTLTVCQFLDVAEAFEAVLGAVFVDSGFEMGVVRARAVVLPRGPCWRILDRPTSAVVPWRAAGFLPLARKPSMCRLCGRRCATCPGPLQPTHLPWCACAGEAGVCGCRTVHAHRGGRQCSCTTS